MKKFSPFIKEGTHRLVEDFGSEHRIYFDILGAISKGHTSRARIIGVNQIEVESFKPLILMHMRFK